MIGRAVVVSDLHLGPGTALTSFRDDAALAALLRRLGGEAAAHPTELVLAGDSFDFLQVEGYDGFDPARACDRFERILRHPPTARVIEALRELAGRPGTEVTVLAGNHDPELLLPEVRARLEAAIGRRGSVRFADDDPLAGHAGDGGIGPIRGRAIAGAATAAWVVHGDQFDGANRIDHDELRRALAAGRRFQLPPGSALVYEVLARIKPRWGFVDELKPELEAVLPLLLYLDPGATMGFLRAHFGITAALLRAMIEDRLIGAARAPEAAEGLPGDVAGLVASALAESLDEEPVARREATLDAIVESLEAGAAERGGIEARAVSHAGAGRALLRAWLLGVRQRERFQALDGPDPTLDLARPHLAPGVTALVAGHTHGPRSRRDLGPVQYFNSGTWVPTSRIPAGDLESLIDALDRGERWPSRAPRSAVVVAAAAGEPRATLVRCRDDGTWEEYPAAG